MSAALPSLLLGAVLTIVLACAQAQEDQVLSTRSLPHPPIGTPPPALPPALLAPVAPPQFRTARLAISIDSARLQQGLNDKELPVPARGDAILLIVRYHYANLTERPIDMRVHRPRLYLMDGLGRRLEPNRRATRDYLYQQDLDTPGLDKLNPLVSVSEAAVFEISPALFDPASWSLLVKAGQDVRVPLALLVQARQPAAR